MSRGFCAPLIWLPQKRTHPPASLAARAHGALQRGEGRAACKGSRAASEAARPHAARCRWAPEGVGLSEWRLEGDDLLARQALLQSAQRRRAARDPSFLHLHSIVEDSEDSEREDAWDRHSGGKAVLGAEEPITWRSNPVQRLPPPCAPIPRLALHEVPDDEAGHGASARHLQQLR